MAAADIHWSSIPDGAYVTWRDNPTNNCVTEHELGVTVRATEESARDTVAWLQVAGHLRL